jgi:imidazolonepropionase-like amidohydrolase
MNYREALLNRFLPLVLVVLLGACAASAEAADSSIADDLAFVNVNVVDVEGESVLPVRTVLIADNRINTVGLGNGVPIAPATRVIDGSGYFLIPGLVDMHVHLFNNVSRRDPNTWALPLFVANGVTGIREMWTEPASMGRVREWRRGVAQEGLLAPRVLAAGALVDGPGAWMRHMPEVTTPAEGRCFVRQASDAGVDFIKVYSLLRPTVYAAILDEARERDMPVAGHIPLQVAALAAAEGGQRTNEHLTQVREACTTIEDRFLEERRRFYSHAYTEDEEVVLLDSEVHRFGDAFDAATCRGVAAHLASLGQWQVPTLINERRWTLGVPEGQARDAWRAYLPPQEREAWIRRLENGSVTYSGDAASLRRSWEATLQVVRILGEAGVGLLAGTDFGQPFVMPGFGLHDELELLVEAGLTPAQALRSATIAPALALGATDSLGSVAPRRLADLVLLAGDPLVDIRNTRRIVAVVLNGRYLDRQALDALLIHAGVETMTER